MKVVIAIDSLKGSLSSTEAGNAVRTGILKAHPDAEVVVRPLADGGEGTAEALAEGFGGRMVSLVVRGPFLQPVRVTYGIVEKSKIAIIEMAAASGIALLKKEELDPLRATTYGVGEMIRDAIGKGCREFIVGIGGSATNDCGMGMLSALGYRFLDEKGKEVSQGADFLDQITNIDDTEAVRELSQCTFRIACDVKNPLYGSNGASYIFGPQKGLKESDKERIDGKVQRFAKMVAAYSGMDHSFAEGAGAAGGMGFAFISFLKGTLEPGITLVMKAINLEECIKDADYVVTGEGRLDSQTMMGKAPAGVAAVAEKYNIPVIAFAGSLSEDANYCNQAGISAFFSILPGIMTLDEAMKSETAIKNMERTAEQVFRLIRSLNVTKKLDHNSVGIII